MSALEALSLHERGCHLGQTRSCAHAAALSLRTQRYGDHTERALARLMSTCEQGFPTSCVFLLQLEHDDPVFREALRFADITLDEGALESACTRGDDDACAAALDTIERCGAQQRWACRAMGLGAHREAPPSPERTADMARPYTEALRERCEAQQPRSCGLLAEYGATADYAETRRDACVGGHAPSCLVLADELRESEERAVMLRRACETGLHRGCSDLRLDELRNESQTLEHLREGCELPDAAMCTAYGHALAAGGERDRARAPYERACDLGDAEGCDAAGLQVPPTSEGDVPNRRRRAGWFTRACALRGDARCAHVEALEREQADADLVACRAGRTERCYGAVLGLAGEDPRAARELIDGISKQPGAACRTSSEACATMQAIHLVVGCGEHGVEECAAGSEARARQRRRARKLEPRYERLLRDECDRGIAAACREIASDVVAHDLPRAAQLYQQACELGDAVSCDQVPAVMSSYRTLSDDENASYQELACAAGDPSACLFVSAYRADTDPDAAGSLRSQARDLLERGCPATQPPVGAWCETPMLIELHVKLKMYGSVVDALRQSCHGADQQSCRALVDALRFRPGSWT